MDWLIANGTFYIVLMIFVLSFRKAEEGSLEPMGFETSREIKGIAIMAVLIGHMAIIFKLLKLPVTEYLGAQGVDLFLFLSAFGLTVSFSKKGLKDFFKKRLLVIFIPYIIFNVVRLPIEIKAMNIPMGILDILKSFLAINVNFDPSMWYVQYIIIWYIIFFAVYSIKPLKINHKAYILLAIGLIFLGITVYISNNNIDVRHPLRESISHHLAFPLGALFFLVYEDLKVKNKWQDLIVSVIALVIYIIASFKIPMLLPYYITNIAFLVFIVFLFMFIAKMGYKSKLLCWLGDLAYYIYLNEMFVMFVFVFSMKLSGAAGVGTILLTTIVLGILTKLPSDLIVKKLR